MTRRVLLPKTHEPRMGSADPVTVAERVEWAWARWSETLRRSNNDPGDRALAAAVASRRAELDALVAVADAATAKRITERQRRRERRKEAA